ncbi:MAG TPA: hypothetical protein VFD02_04910 [Syntrophomonadaceae bacterium]|nr:hypothetical protein [Syntrophomonadaceae bacterium]
MRILYKENTPEFIYFVTLYNIFSNYLDELTGDKRIRTAWDEEGEEWYFSVVDVVGVLTDSKEPRRYWSDLKIKLKNEGNQLYDKIVQLKMTAAYVKKD